MKASIDFGVDNVGSFSKCNVEHMDEMIEKEEEGVGEILSLKCWKRNWKHVTKLNKFASFQFCQLLKILKVVHLCEYFYEWTSVKIFRNW